MKVYNLSLDQLLSNISTNIPGVDSNYDYCFDIAVKGISSFFLINIGKEATLNTQNIFFAHYSYSTLFNRNNKMRWYDLNLRERFQKALIPYFESITILRHEEPTKIKTFFKYRERLI